MSRIKKTKSIEKNKPYHKLVFEMADKNECLKTFIKV